MTLDVRLRHSFPNFTADTSFSAPAPGVTTLFGPSGCGKSLVLAAVAGLLKADEVRVVLDGVVLSDLAPPDRRIGVVFQDGRVFPHLSVAANLRYGLRRAPPGPVGFDETVELLGIGHLLDRRPHRLSGGERQRVAIGRALLSQPRLLVMDEPLSALDAARKAEILPFLARLHDEARMPILLVTHSIEEVARLADTLVLMQQGRVTVVGPVGEVLARADLPFATESQAGAVLAADVLAHDAARALTRLDAEGIEVLVPALDRPPGSRLRIRIPAAEVMLATEAPRHLGANNLIAGQVRRIRETPDRRMAVVEVAAGRALLLAQLSPDAVHALALAPDRPVLALFRSVGVQLL